MSGLRYRVDGREFLERRRRASAVLARAMSGDDFDPGDLLRDWQAIVNEVPELPFEPGGLYRIRCIAGEPQVRHVHLRQEATGIEVGLDVPVETAPEAREEVLMFEARINRLPGGGSSLLFVTRDGARALLADIDIIEARELSWAEALEATHHDAGDGGRG